MQEMYESHSTDEEWKALAEAYRQASGVSSDCCADYVPGEFYLDTADDPRWEDPNYSLRTRPSAVEVPQ